MNLIGKFDPKVFKYLSSAEKYKFLSKDIQNEVLQCISHSVLRDLIDRVRKESIGKTKEPFYSIIVDETSDINRCEQVSFCVRFCNNKMESEEVFLGFHQTDRTDSETLLNLVKSSLLSLGLSFYGVRGQAYDGASNMAGRHNGLQAKILAENRKALYLYCFGHQLNLVVQDSVNSIPEVALALGRMNSVVHFLKNSPKRLDRFKDIVSQIEAGEFQRINHMVRPLCPTRWVMRLPAVDSFLEHYDPILDFLEILKNDTTEPTDNRAMADNLLQNLETFQMYFCLRVVQKLLQVVHPIHKMCQGRKATAGDVKLWVNSLSLSLFAEGNNPANANALYDAVKIVTLETLHLNLPALPRAKRAGGARGNPSAGDPVTEEHIKKFYEGIYTSVMNSGARALTERYSRQDLEMVELLRCALEDESMNEKNLTTLANFYEGDVSLDNLRFERNMWFGRCHQEDAQSTINTLRKKLVDEEVLKLMIPNMHILCLIYLCLSVSTCEAERSFSMLRRVHTYLRCSQTQQRLNHFAVLSAHKDVVRTLELDAIMDEFVNKTVQRQNMFGPNI